MSLNDMRGTMTARLAELQPFAGRVDLTADESARVDALLNEINDLGAKIDRAMGVESALATLAEPQKQRASGLIAGEEREVRVERHSPLADFLRSEQYASALTSPKGISQPFEVGNLRERGNRFVWNEGDKPLSAREVRAVIHSGTPSASMLLPDVRPGIYRAAEAPLVMRDVIINASTQSDTVTILQESGFTNNAAEVAEATATNGAGLAGGVKPESALTFTEVSYPVRWIAHWIPITRQMLEDLPAMESYVEERLLTGLDRREDNQFLNGNGSPPNITGILVDAGIQVLDGTYFSGAPVKGAGDARENFDRVLRARTLVQTVGRAMATFVVMNPTNFEAMYTAVDLQDRYYAGGPFSAPSIPTIHGLPLVLSENIAANTALVGDGTMAAIFDRHDARIYTTDSHSDFFIRNLLVMLAEERLALALFRPAAFAKVSLVA